MTGPLDMEHRFLLCILKLAKAFHKTACRQKRLQYTVDKACITRIYKPFQTHYTVFAY
jgi:hypothetical protein